MFPFLVSQQQRAPIVWAFKSVTIFEITEAATDETTCRHSKPQTALVANKKSFFISLAWPRALNKQDDASVFEGSQVSGAFEQGGHIFCLAAMFSSGDFARYSIVLLMGHLSMFAK